MNKNKLFESIYNLTSKSNFKESNWYEDYGDDPSYQNHYTWVKMPNDSENTKRPDIDFDLDSIQVDDADKDLFNDFKLKKGASLSMIHYIYTHNVFFPREHIITQTEKDTVAKNYVSWVMSYFNDYKERHLKSVARKKELNDTHRLERIEKLKKLGIENPDFDNYDYKIFKVKIKDSDIHDTISMSVFNSLKKRGIRIAPVNLNVETSLNDNGTSLIWNLSGKNCKADIEPSVLVDDFISNLQNELSTSVKLVENNDNVFKIDIEQQYKVEKTNKKPWQK